MVRLVCARTTTRTTMPLSSLVRTGITSKWFATNPRPNPSIERRFLERRLQELEKNDWAAVENVGCQTTGGAAQLKQKEKVT